MISCGPCWQEGKIEFTSLVILLIKLFIWAIRKIQDRKMYNQVSGNCLIDIKKCHS